MNHPLDHASRALATHAEMSSHELRTAALEALLTIAPGSFGLSFGLATCQEKLHYSEGAVTGDDDAVRWMRTWFGTPMLDTLWNPLAPAPSEVNAIAVQTIGDMKGLSVYDSILGPLEVTHSLRVLVYDGNEFVCWFGVKRRGRDRGFTADEVQTASRVFREIRAVVMTAHHLDRAALGRPCLLGVLTPDGRVEFATREFSQWLDEDRAHYLRRWVRDFDAGVDELVRCVGRAEVRMVRLDLADGVRYLASVTQAKAARVRPFHALSRRQREVVHYLAIGLTVPEVAEMLRISVHTAEEHRNRAFSQLGISSAFELSKLTIGDGSRDGR